MMRRTIFATMVSVALAATVSAQTTAAPATLRLTVDEAVRLALEHNLDLTADRLEPQISDARVAAAASAFKPSFDTALRRNNQLLPPQSFLIPTSQRTDVMTSSAGLSQLLPWGTSYSVSWTATHTNSNSILNSYNPLVQSGLLISLSQPLLRNRAIDAARQRLATSRIDRDISDTRLRESLVHTTANVKATYWNLVSALATVDARQKALDLAQELVRVNRAKVDVGQSPPLDMVSAQAEVAADEEQLIIAETSVKQIEDRLRLLIFDMTDPDVWSVKLEPIDSPPTGLGAPDVERAITAAIGDRTDLVRARKDILSAQTTLTFASSQRLPDVRLNASYAANGLGGTQILRSGGFPGTITGSGDVVDFGSIVGQLFGQDYPTWSLGVSVSYPIGQSAAQADFARARLEKTRSENRLKSSEARVIQQVRDAAWKIDMNAKRIGTTTAARELAEQRLDSEQKRFEVGMSTSFLVIQAQRDLAQTKTNELAAILAYDLALVDFEALQQASPAGASTASATTGSSSSAASSGSSSNRSGAGE